MRKGLSTSGERGEAAWNDLALTHGRSPGTEEKQDMYDKERFEERQLALSGLNDGRQKEAKTSDARIRV